MNQRYLTQKSFILFRSIVIGTSLLDFLIPWSSMTFDYIRKSIENLLVGLCFLHFVLIHSLVSLQFTLLSKMLNHYFSEVSQFYSKSNEQNVW